MITRPKQFLASLFSSFNFQPSLNKQQQEQWFEETNMSFSRAFLTLCLLSLLLSPVYPGEDQGRSSVGGRQRKLVRRKKQPLDWDLEESRNIIYKSNDQGTIAENREVRPMKVKKRKIVKKNKINQTSHISPSHVGYPRVQPSRPNISQTVPAKPDDAKRFLSLFTIVSFKNDACTSLTGNNGTCFSSRDCDSQGGIKSGTCASGFGVCCLFSSSCGGVTSINGTYFQSAGYPSTYDSVGSCQLTVNKCAESVCQLRY